MAISLIDGHCGLDCWLSSDTDIEPDQLEYSDNVQEQRDRAAVLIGGGRFEDTARSSHYAIRSTRGA